MSVTKAVDVIERMHNAKVPGEYIGEVLSYSTTLEGIISAGDELAANWDAGYKLPEMGLDTEERVIEQYVSEVSKPTISVTEAIFADEIIYRRLSAEEKIWINAVMSGEQQKQEAAVRDMIRLSEASEKRQRRRPGGREYGKSGTPSQSRIC
jgi:hypothetical protein